MTILMAIIAAVVIVAAPQSVMVGLRKKQTAPRTVVARG